MVDQLGIHFGQSRDSEPEHGVVGTGSLSKLWESVIDEMPAGQICFGAHLVVNWRSSRTQTGESLPTA